VTPTNSLRSVCLTIALVSALGSCRRSVPSAPSPPSASVLKPLAPQPAATAQTGQLTVTTATPLPVAPTLADDPILALDDALRLATRARVWLGGRLGRAGDGAWALDGGGGRLTLRFFTGQSLQSSDGVQWSLQREGCRARFAQAEAGCDGNARGLVEVLAATAALADANTARQHDWRIESLSGCAGTSPCELRVASRPLRTRCTWTLRSTGAVEALHCGAGAAVIEGNGWRIATGDRTLGQLVPAGPSPAPSPRAAAEVRAGQTIADALGAFDGTVSRLPVAPWSPGELTFDLPPAATASALQTPVWRTIAVPIATAPTGPATATPGAFEAAVTFAPGTIGQALPPSLAAGCHVLQVLGPALADPAQVTAAIRACEAPR
jgi:hypothetical protein